jgi:hypothetical protein
MTNPELITDEIVYSFQDAYNQALVETACEEQATRIAILAIQDDITRPVYNLLRGWERDAQAYERALQEIRKGGSNVNEPHEIMSYSAEIADKALKGEYHEPREE